jgi:hypothetical protein
LCPLKIELLQILFSEREIKAGEEICITYSTFNSPDNDKSADALRYILKTKWGIDCPPNCFYLDPEVLEAVEKAKDLDSKIFQFGRMGDPEKALEAVKQLLVQHDVIRSSLLNKKKTYEEGVQLWVTKRKHFPEARKYSQELYDLTSCILHPNSPETLKYEMWKNDLSTHYNYLFYEGGGMYLERMFNRHMEGLLKNM